MLPTFVHRVPLFPYINLPSLTDLKLSEPLLLLTMKELFPVLWIVVPSDPIIELPVCLNIVLVPFPETIYPFPIGLIVLKELLFPYDGTEACTIVPGSYIGA